MGGIMTAIKQLTDLIGDISLLAAHAIKFNIIYIV